ncbi:MAG: ABC transporter permease [Deferribacteraceae bacterium]|jgi:lipooligosaccharide transport system permease protein|nr:ABC transporter permease [Deferribacteraceae bacterium]
MLNIIYGWRVFMRNIKVFYKLYKYNLVINFIEPSLYLFAFGIGLGNYVSDINGMRYIEYIAPGMVCYTGLFAAAFECLYGTYTRMVYQKTFDAILTTPVNKTGVILGEIFYGAAKAVLFAIIIMIVVYVFGLIRTPYLLLALPFIWLGGVIFGGIALVVTARVKGIESFNYFVTLILSPLMLLSGIFFPLTGLLEKISVVSPFYQVAKICQLMAAGEIAAVWSHGLIVIFMAVISVALALIFMTRRLAQ